MVDEETGKVVDDDDKGRGYELSKDKYVEIQPEEVKAIQVESTHTLDINKFVPIEEIDRRYFDRAYYIVPDGKAGEEAFVVIRDAMKDKSRVPLARIVLTNREHVIAIELSSAGTPLAAQRAMACKKHMVRRGAGTGASERRSDAEAMSDSLPPELFQGRSFMHRDVVRFIAFDFVLRLVFTGVMRVPLVVHVL
jgi:Ku protein